MSFIKDPILRQNSDLNNPLEIAVELYHVQN
jgi:hypothetical protein